jgi:hypothetical protein
MNVDAELSSSLIERELHVKAPAPPIQSKESQSTPVKVNVKVSALNLSGAGRWRARGVGRGRAVRGAAELSVWKLRYMHGGQTKADRTSVAGYYP